MEASAPLPGSVAVKASTPVEVRGQRLTLENAARGRRARRDPPSWRQPPAALGSSCHSQPVSSPQADPFGCALGRCRANLLGAPTPSCPLPGCLAAVALQNLSQAFHAPALESPLHPRAEASVHAQPQGIHGHRGPDPHQTLQPKAWGSFWEPLHTATAPGPPAGPAHNQADQPTAPFDTATRSPLPHPASGSLDSSLCGRSWFTSALRQTQDPQVGVSVWAWVPTAGTW